MSKQGPYPQSDRDLIRRIERSAGQRAGYKQLIRELGLGGGRERRLLLEQLARITVRGELVKTEEEQWALPNAILERTARPPRAETLPTEFRATRDRLVAGRLDLHRDGYGFVRPNGAASRDDDLFVPPSELNGAMQGDEVLVDEAPPGRDGRRSGRIARILTRRNPTVVGIFHYAKPQRRSAWDDAPLVHGNYVTPLDERMTQPILIPEGMEQPAVPAVSPHRVLGEETLARQPVGTELEGLAVDVEITDFPAPGRPARGRLLEVLGPPDAFGVDVEIVIRKHHLPHTFPANVLLEAATAAAQTVGTLTHAELTLRRDLRLLPEGQFIVTIDGETARDFDDAVMVLPLANGNFELHVHIADVSHYVRPATSLDLEARLRGTSVYFPDRAVPMLPHELSSGMCSLRPEEDRLVLSCVMEVDTRGEIVGYEVGESIIRSARRMTYTEVQHLLDAVAESSPPATDLDTYTPADANPETSPIAHGGVVKVVEADTPARAEIHPSQRIRNEVEAKIPGLPEAVDRMYALALKLNAKRRRRGSIDFDLPEPVILFDPDGNMASVVRSQRGWSHRLIEEFMLSANECVAHWIEANSIPSLYRIHEVPDPKRIIDFEETAATFGYSLGFSNLPVRRVTMKADRRDVRKGNSGGGANRSVRQHELPESIPVTPQMYQKLTARIAGQPEERMLAFLMLRSLKQARYSEKNAGHFALASPSYTHFTSPIRRYPDLIVHRLIRSLLQAGADPHGDAILSTDPQPWTPEKLYSTGRFAPEPGRGQTSVKGAETRQGQSIFTEDTSRMLSAALSEPELAAIAAESSQAERRADDAERELIEWKKIKFMQDRVGEEFDAIILSCTKYGFFVELDDLFIEGLVPLTSLEKMGRFGDDDRFVFRDTDRTIVGSRSGRIFKMGLRLRVMLDRIDRQQRRLQFALLPDPLSQQGTASKKRGGSKTSATPAGARPYTSPKRSGKPAKVKARERNRKSKGKRT